MTALAFYSFQIIMLECISYVCDCVEKKKHLSCVKK